MISLDTPVETILGVGPKLTPKLHNLGIQTLKQLIEWYPFRYIDLTCPTPIAKIRVGQPVVIDATVDRISTGRTYRKRMAILQATISDRSGSIEAVWYNQPYLIQKLKKGSRWVFYGEVAFRPKKILQAPIINHEPRIIPIYHETEGINSYWFHKIISSVIKQIELTDYLPTKILAQENLISLAQAIEYIHNPLTQHQIEQARQRISFDELLLILIKVLSDKAAIHRLQAPKASVDSDKLKALVSQLPYQLTAAQKKAAWKIILDLVKPQPMNRLLQGDVGSGKTVVAALAAFVMTLSKYQTIWLAPTEILAQQHYQTLKNILSPFKVSVGLWTANIKETGGRNIWVGTHALLGDAAPIENVGLIIVDEQHRFGVQQRAKLRHTNRNIAQVPHFLSMTATPIPRTLALTLYGDLDVSVIDELPPGRQKIITRIVQPGQRAEAYKFLRSQLSKERQIYVVTPLIEENLKNSTKLLDIERKSVMKEYEHLSKDIFPDYKIGFLHGKLKGKEKQSIMEQFKNKKLDVLVSTTVIEVGIDVPNATVIMVEDAERFGLAQLHQLRGRVGRGAHQSYCFLFAGLWSVAIAKRLKAMQKYNSGLKLAEIDLELRGPGELVGSRQSGLPDLKMASLTDTITITKVRMVAQKLIDDGLDKYPLLQNKISDMLTTRHME